MPLPVVVPDRLNELLRQRALLEEHLAWLEREIATASARKDHPAPAAPQVSATAEAAAAVPAPTVPSPIAAVTVIPSSSSRAPIDADALLQRYGQDARTSPADLKKGCWMAFSVVLAAVVAAALAVYGAWFFLWRS